MKTTNELLAIIDDICPTIKSSEKLFIVGLVLDEQAAAYKEAVDKAMDNVNSMSEHVEELTYEEHCEAADRLRDEERDDAYDKASSNRGELI